MPAEVFVNADWADLADGTVVGPGQVIGDNAFGTVQAGVDAVDAGGTVHVAAGVYNELVFILGPEKEGITVRGEANAVLDGTGFGTNERGFSVGSDGVTIEGFTVRNYPQSYSIFITDCDDVTVRNNEIIDNGMGPSGFRGGVYVRGSANLVFEGNVIANNRNEGVVLDWGVYGAVVRNNTFRGNRNQGLFLGGTGGTAPTSTATVEDNLFEENGSGVATPEDPTSFSIPGNAGVVVWDAGARFQEHRSQQRPGRGCLDPLRLRPMGGQRARSRVQQSGAEQLPRSSSARGQQLVGGFHGTVSAHPQPWRTRKRRERSGSVQSLAHAGSSGRGDAQYDPPTGSL